MDAQQFLAEFGHIANAPGGVVRLREMVFVLAASGDLVTTEKPESAAPLLLSIKEQKRNHPEQKKIVSDQEPIPVHLTKAPVHWASCRLGDLTLTITGGGTPSKNNPAYWNGDIPWASVKDLKDLKYLSQTEDHISEAGLKNSSSNLIPPNRMIVCTRMGLGKIVINTVPMAINQDLKALELPPEVNPDFFFIFYKTLELKGTGTTVAGIKQDQLLALPAALPPLEEQSRIVAKVDELMALCDKLETQQKARRKLQNKLRLSILQAVTTAISPHELQTTWTRLADNFGQLFHAPEDVAELTNLVFDLAIQGLLTDRSFDDEAPETLIARSNAAKIARLESGEMKNKKPSATDIREVEFFTPSHWMKASLEDLFQFIDYRGKTPTKTNGGVVLVTAKNVRPGVLASEPIEYMSQASYSEWMTRGFPQLGDLLITTEAPLGNIARINEVPNFALAQRVINFQPFADINTRCAMYFMMSPIFQKLLDENSTGMTAKGIKAGKLKQLQLPVPPKEEQDRIVARVEELLKICGVLASKIETSLKQASRLAIASVSSITGIATEQKEEPMKAPQTELIAPLRLGKTPDIKAQSPLATILARHHGEMPAKDLWQRFGGEIDAFYAQLKTEVAHGWILEPAVAEVREQLLDTAA